MTCVATDGRVVAADGLIVSEKSLILSTNFEKITLLDDGRVYGGAGDVASIINARGWLNAGAPQGNDRPLVDKDSFEGLVLDTDGRVFWFDVDGVFVPYDPPFAIGIGGTVAIALMRNGMRPEEAVREAAASYATVGGAITVLGPRKDAK